MRFRSTFIAALAVVFLCGVSAAGQYDAPAFTEPEALKSPEQLAWEALVAPKYKPIPALRYVQDDPTLPRALLIGDSISVGYTTRVQEALNGKVNVHRIPVNGGSTQTGLEQIDQWLAWREHWDVIHFNWGIHDLTRMIDGKPELAGSPQVPLGQYAENIEKLVVRLKQSNARLIWATTTPVAESADGRIRGDEVMYNAAAAKIMKKHGVQINDLHSFILPRLAEAQNPRDVHFADPGNDLLAGQVAAAITAALKHNEPAVPTHATGAPKLPDGGDKR